MIKDLNEHCVIVETNYGKVDLKYILDTTSFEMNDEIENELKNHHHDHDNGIGEYFFKTSEICYSLKNIEFFLTQLSDDIFRVKGFIHLKEDKNNRYIIQKTGSSFAIVPDNNWDKKDRLSRIVFIGKNIDKNVIQDSLLREVFF